MLESGRRAMPYELARLAAETLHAPPTALPLRARAFETPAGSEKLSLQLTALVIQDSLTCGQKRAAILPRFCSTALNAANLDNRVTEGLPWLALAYRGHDWDWVVQNAKPA